MEPLVVALLATLLVAALAIGWLVAQQAAARQSQPPAEPLAPPAPPVDVAALVAAARAEAREEAAQLAAEQQALLQQQHAMLQASLSQSLSTLQQQSLAEREAALAQLATIAKEHLGAQVAASQAELTAKKDVIDTTLEQMKGEMRSELGRLGQIVAGLGERSAEQFGQVDQSLRAHAEIVQHLSTTTQSLREALANSKTRGQWGERMAEDVLRLAGFIENVNYVKQTAVEGDGRGMPDFTFFMPKQHVLYMDVKFPLSSYLKYLDAGTEAERQAHRDQFLRDVRMRVRELSKREYAKSSSAATVDQVLLFLPNESLSAFIIEQDPTIVDEAMKQGIVLCSPVTLLAFLGLIRQAFDSFMIEQTSDQILALLGKFGEQWGKYTDSLDTVKKRFDSVQREFDNLLGTRKRALERPLRELDAIRREKGLPVDGQLFETTGTDPAWDNVRELGA
ncbi:MAG: DNA recombination protein RmuC [Actinobacteria bacterium]|nr:DNA recombination protein RmuC [Actinomycetota bacterium]